MCMIGAKHMIQVAHPPGQKYGEGAKICRVRRRLIIFIILLTACGLRPGRLVTPNATAVPATSSAVIAAATATPSPAIATRPPAASSTPLPTATTSPYILTSSDVHFEPGPQLYSGDVA